MPIETEIRTLRRERVILDADLARIYGVTTKRLNEQVKRNPDRFPSDFVIRFTKTEWKGLTSQSTKAFSSANRSQIATGSQKHRDPRFLWASRAQHKHVLFFPTNTIYEHDHVIFRNG